jgi:2-polyprenyl-6-methoxyphenol hydroxylase-like FAD-dependent oxidoreductase
MSPIAGVGINLAVQDAVAAANVLVPLLRGGGEVGTEPLARIQRRRALPTRLTQAMQVLIQNRVLSRVLASTAPVRPALPFRLLNRFPLLQRIPARLIGIGFRPEHVHTPEVVPRGSG